MNKETAFQKNKEEVRKAFATAFVKALTQMGEQAKDIEWFGTGHGIVHTPRL